MCRPQAPRLPGIAVNPSPSARRPPILGTSGPPQRIKERTVTKFALAFLFAALTVAPIFIALAEAQEAGVGEGEPDLADA